MRIASTLGQSKLLYALINNTTFAFSGFDAYVGFMHMENALTRRVPLMEQELLTLPVHLSSPPVLMVFVLLDL
jgi:hypothetical protein